MGRTVAKAAVVVLGTMVALACGGATGPGNLLDAVMLNSNGTRFACPATPGAACIGFVGRRAVAGAFGLSDQTLQNEIVATNPPTQAFLFSLAVAGTYQYVCAATTGTGKPTTHTATQTTTTGIVEEFNADPGTDPAQWTGFNLLSFGSAIETGDVIPAVNDPCPGIADATVASVALQSTAGALLVTRTSPDPDQVAQLHWP